ncbi:MAG: tryptophan synthase subunit alpha [Archaeoglobi archaeon]|nr:tryptophan synthase subunit alpha [Candidatus Mnemosynella sp.]
MLGKGLIAYITAGDPSREATLKFLEVLDEYCDAIELGIPFSDPMADGPVIQQASFRAIKNGFRVRHVFEIVSSFREISDKPIILMSYWNPIFRIGPERFLDEMNSCGADALLVVDLPYDEAGDYIEMTERKGIKRVFLAAPNTSEERLRKIDELSSFVYLISLYGVTGERERISPVAFEALRRAKKICRKPVAVGFGISREEHVRALLREGADGVVVGSTIVRIIGEDGEMASRRIEEKLRELRRAFEK